MATVPIVVHVISITISHACATRSKAAITKANTADPSPAAIHAAVAGVVAVNKHAAFPILIWSAAIKASVTRVVAVNKHIGLSA